MNPRRTMSLFLLLSARALLFPGLGCSGPSCSDKSSNHRPAPDPTKDDPYEVPEFTFTAYRLFDPRDGTSREIRIDSNGKVSCTLCERGRTPTGIVWKKAEFKIGPQRVRELRDMLKRIDFLAFAPEYRQKGLFDAGSDSFQYETRRTKKKVFVYGRDVPEGIKRLRTFVEQFAARHEKDIAKAVVVPKPLPENRSQKERKITDP